jgi:hypothetical protein
MGVYMYLCMYTKSSLNLRKVQCKCPENSTHTHIVCILMKVNSYSKHANKKPNVLQCLL